MADQTSPPASGIDTGRPSVARMYDYVAQAAAPGSRVVYVDHDPIAVVHGQALLAVHTRVRALIDFDRPVAILILAVLHFVGDQDDPTGTLRRLRERMAPGSYLAVLPQWQPPAVPGGVPLPGADQPSGDLRWQAAGVGRRS